MILRLNASTHLHWRRWDDEWTVFDVGSGQTHQMDTLTAVTLMFLETDTLEENELISRIAEEFLIPFDMRLSGAMKNILERLIHIGLIESSST